MIIFFVECVLLGKQIERGPEQELEKRRLFRSPRMGNTSAGKLLYDCCQTFSVYVSSKSPVPGMHRRVSPERSDKVDDVYDDEEKKRRKTTEKKGRTREESRGNTAA